MRSDEIKERCQEEIRTRDPMRSDEISREKIKREMRTRSEERSGRDQDEISMRSGRDQGGGQGRGEAATRRAHEDVVELEVVEEEGAEGPAALGHE